MFENDKPKKLSKRVLKSCVGCVVMRKYYCYQGMNKLERDIKMGSFEPISGRYGNYCCDLGFKVDDVGDGEYKPLERCPKPKTYSQAALSCSIRYS